ncbi:MAG: GTP-binding protein, partial [Hyphomonadaceae bacterium]|nr:GTP-binding protein [Hyphomonadaceae bacterium]
DLALLVDGLAAEREQGITIDVAYRFFNTDRRRYIVADTPGHEQYTRNMATGASTADLAVLLVDARTGILTQTRRHACIASLLGVAHVVLAVNKMDLVGWSRERFDSIVDDFAGVAADLGFVSITPIPMSALTGDNVVTRSPLMDWYRGPSLLDHLDTVPLAPVGLSGALRLPVQWVNRPHLDFRGYAGLIEAGKVAVGDTLAVSASGQTAKVARILIGATDVGEAAAGRSVTITLDREVDVSRGDVLVSAADPLPGADLLEADIVWMDARAGLPGRSMLIKCGTASAGAAMSAIDYRLDVNTFARMPATALASNDIARVTLTLDRALGIEPFGITRALGSFILIDRQTNATLAAGMVRGAGRHAASRVGSTQVRVDQTARERLNGHPAKLVWLTGASRQDRQAVAQALELRLHHKGKRTFLLDHADSATIAPVLVEAGLIVIASADGDVPHGATRLAVQPERPVADAVEAALAAISFDADDGTLFHL